MSYLFTSFSTRIILLIKALLREPGSCGQVYFILASPHTMLHSDQAEHLSRMRSKEASIVSTTAAGCSSNDAPSVPMAHNALAAP